MTVVLCMPSVRTARTYVTVHYYSRHADDSRGSKAFSGVCVCVCDSVCLSVCPHDKIKTAETKIAKLGTAIVHHDT